METEFEIRGWSKGVWWGDGKKVVGKSKTEIAHLIRPRGYKTFSMLNSAEHEILNAHKYKNIKKFSFFQVQISLECHFSCSLMLKCQHWLAF